jgi:hypothetical protein
MQLSSSLFSKKNKVWNSRQICGFSLYLRRDVYHNLQMVFRTIFIQYLFQEETVVQNYLHTICFEEETVTRKFQTLLCLCVDYRWKRVQVWGSENSNTSETIFQHRMPEGSCPNPMCLKECHFKGRIHSRWSNVSARFFRLFSPPFKAPDKGCQITY